MVFASTSQISWQIGLGPLQGSWIDGMFVDQRASRALLTKRNATTWGVAGSGHGGRVP